jgi:hypothetical protein
MNALKTRLRVVESRLGSRSSVGLVLLISVWSLVGLVEFGRQLHDLFCAEHGAWPLLHTILATAFDWTSSGYQLASYDNLLP